MAQGLPSNIYSGGAVVFNSQPYTQFYLNSLAKKRAKDEALDNYFMNFNKSINPAGMRTQDIEGGWMNKVNDWQNFYQQNKKLIENPKLDNGRAYNEYLSRYNDLNADVQKSKNLAQISSQYVVPIVSNPDKRNRLQDNGIQAIHAHDQPMYSDQFRQLDPSVLDYGAKPFSLQDAQRLDKLALNVKKSGTITNNVVDPKTKTRFTTTEASYTTDDLKTIANIYRDNYQTDDSFKNSIHDLRENTDQYDVFNNAFKKVYGRDIANDSDMAAAYGLSRIQQQQQQQKASSYSPYSPWDYEATREKFHDYTQSDVNNSIDENVNRQINYAQNILNSPWSSGLEAVDLPVDPATLKALNVERLQLSKDGQHIIPVWTQTTKDPQTGESTSETVQGTPMTIDDYKMAVGKRNIGAKYFEKKSKPETKVSSSSSSKQINNLPATNGKVDISHLKKGASYKYNGKQYLWDGSKLIPQ